MRALFQRNVPIKKEVYVKLEYARQLFAILIISMFRNQMNGVILFKYFITNIIMFWN